MMRRTNILVLSTAVALVSLVTLTACHRQVGGQPDIAASTDQGFLPVTVKDVLALLGGIVLLVQIYLKLRASTRLGRVRGLYTRYLLPRLLSRSYEREEVESVNRFLEEIAIGKLASRDKAQRKTGIDQLAGVPPTDRGFQVLAMALTNERSKDLRKQIVRVLDSMLDEL